MEQKPNVPNSVEAWRKRVDEYADVLLKEIDAPHWSQDQKQMLRYALKWLRNYIPITS